MSRPAAVAFAALLLVVVAGPAPGADTRPGSVATEAFTSLSVVCFGPCDPDFNDEFSETVDGVNGVASSSYDRPKGTGRTSVDAAAGTLRAYLAGSVDLPAEPAGALADSFGHAEAELADTITLSSAATVVLEGRIDGQLSLTRGLGGDSAQYPVQLAAEIELTGPRVGEGRVVYGAWSRSFVDGETAAESFSVPIDLPAGTSNFNAAIRALTDLKVSSGNTESGTIDFSNGLTFRLVVSEGVTATSGSGLLPGTSGRTPRLSIADAQVAEGDAGTTPLELAVTLSDASPGPVTVDFETADLDTTSGDDYQETTGTLTFSPGETTKTVIVPVNGDELAEIDELLIVKLKNASGALIGVGAGFGTIVNDDGTPPPPPTGPSLSVGDVSVTEGDAGTSPVSFAVTLSEAAASPVIVNVATADGTATAGSDYEESAIEVTFAPGETQKAVEIMVFGDTVDEPDETFTAFLYGPSGAAIADGNGVAAIVDDDGAPPPSGPCILVRPNTPVDFGTRAFSTPAAPVKAAGSAEVTVENCGFHAATVLVEGTNAAGGSATWLLSDAADPCSVGENFYRLALGSLALDGVRRPFASLAPGASRTETAELTMPCTGSGGAGETLGMQILFTSTAG